VQPNLRNWPPILLAANHSQRSSAHDVSGMLTPAFDNGVRLDSRLPFNSGGRLPKSTEVSSRQSTMDSTHRVARVICGSEHMPPISPKSAPYKGLPSKWSLNGFLLWLVFSNHGSLVGSSHTISFRAQSWYSTVWTLKALGVMCYEDSDCRTPLMLYVNHVALSYTV
jgi:hypothetical protein